MRIRGAVFVTVGLFFAISGLIFHFLAMFSKRWTVAIPRKSRGPNDQIHYYGLWTRCQYSNTSFVTPDISSQPNVENFVCRPNTYLRYNTDNPEIAQTCYHSRHQCSSIIGVPSDCKCRYLHVTQAQQWCVILAAIFLISATLLLYLKLIVVSDNRSARLCLTFSPMIFFSLALVLMITTMILVAVYLRRNEYEDYDTRLPKHLLSSSRPKPDTFNLYRLKAFFKNSKNPTPRRQAISIFKSIHKERFRARIDWSAAAEITAIVFTLLADLLSIFLARGPIY